MLPAFIVPAAFISIQNDQQQKSGNNDKLEDLFGNNKIMNIQSEIEVLKSKPLMERVVNKLNLQTSYYVLKAKSKAINIYKQGPFLLKIFKLKDSSRTFSLNIKFIKINSFILMMKKLFSHLVQFFEIPMAYSGLRGILRL